MESLHSTTPTTCLARSARISAGSSWDLASTLLTTAMRGGRRTTASSAAPSRSTAGCMSTVWKAPATSSRTHFIAPAPGAASSRRPQAAADPDTTTLPGQSTLATSSTSPSRHPAQSEATAGRSSPSTATMAPGLRSAHSCIARPRTSTRRTASSKERTPAKTSAVYSPSDRPAVIAAASSGWPSRDRSTSSAARLVTRIAGWLTAVVLSRSAGPCRLTASRS